MVDTVKPQIITVASLQEGSGKTSLTVNLALALSQLIYESKTWEMFHRSPIIVIDPTNAYRYGKGAISYMVKTEEIPINKPVVMGSDLGLGFPPIITRTQGFNELKRTFDIRRYVLIDTSQYDERTLFEALMMSDSVIIPVTAGNNSIESFCKTVDIATMAARQKQDSTLKLECIVKNKYPSDSDKSAWEDIDYFLSQTFADVAHSPTILEIEDNEHIDRAAKEHDLRHSWNSMLSRQAYSMIAEHVMSKSARRPYIDLIQELASSSMKSSQQQSMQRMTLPSLSSLEDSFSGEENRVKPGVGNSSSDNIFEQDIDMISRRPEKAQPATQLENKEYLNPTALFDFNLEEDFDFDFKVDSEELAHPSDDLKLEHAQISKAVSEASQYVVKEHIVPQNETPIRTEEPQNDDYNIVNLKQLIPDDAKDIIEQIPTEVVEEVVSIGDVYSSKLVQRPAQRNAARSSDRRTFSSRKKPLLERMIRPIRKLAVGMVAAGLISLPLLYKYSGSNESPDIEMSMLTEEDAEAMARAETGSDKVMIISEEDIEKNELISDLQDLSTGMVRKKIQVGGDIEKRLGCFDGSAQCMMKRLYEGSAGVMRLTAGFDQQREIHGIGGEGSVTKRYKSHGGYDLAPADGREGYMMYPFADGKILWAKWFSSACGYGIGIQYTPNLVASYCHLNGSSPYTDIVQHMRTGKGLNDDIKEGLKGAFISKNTPIGRLGNTGRSTGPHTHIQFNYIGQTKEGTTFWAVVKGPFWFGKLKEHYLLGGK